MPGRDGWHSHRWLAGEHFKYLRVRIWFLEGMSKVSRVDYRKWDAWDSGNFWVSPYFYQRLFLKSVKCKCIEGAGQVSGTA